MNDSSETWHAELQVAISAAQAGGETALHFFGHQGPITWKSDGSPVGEADHAADVAIQQCIRTAFPDDAILTEESEAQAGNSGRRWIIDPVDGTRDFLRGLPYWAILIALETHGEIVVGVLHLAALGKLYAAARGAGAWRDGVQIRIRADAVLSRGSLVFGEPDCLLNAVDSETFGRLMRIAGSARSYGAPYGAAMLLDAQADVWMEGNVSLWDIAPFAVLFEEAGASFSDLNGNHYWPVHSGLAAAPRLHREVLTVIRASASP